MASLEQRYEQQQRDLNEARKELAEVKRAQAAAQRSSPATPPVSRGVKYKNKRFSTVAQRTFSVPIGAGAEKADAFQRDWAILMRERAIFFKKKLVGTAIHHINIQEMQEIRL